MRGSAGPWALLGRASQASPASQALAPTPAAFNLPGQTTIRHWRVCLEEGSSARQGELGAWTPYPQPHTHPCCTHTCMYTLLGNPTAHLCVHTHTHTHIYTLWEEQSGPRFRSISLVHVVIVRGSGGICVPKARRPLLPTPASCSLLEPASGIVDDCCSPRAAWLLSEAERECCVWAAATTAREAMSRCHQERSALPTGPGARVGATAKQPAAFERKMAMGEPVPLLSLHWPLESLTDLLRSPNQLPHTFCSSQLEPLSFCLHTCPTTTRLMAGVQRCEDVSCSTKHRVPQVQGDSPRALEPAPWGCLDLSSPTSCPSPPPSALPQPQATCTHGAGTALDPDSHPPQLGPPPQAVWAGGGAQSLLSPLTG